MTVSNSELALINVTMIVGLLILVGFSSGTFFASGVDVDDDSLIDKEESGLVIFWNEFAAKIIVSTLIIPFAVSSMIIILKESEKIKIAKWLTVSGLGYVMLAIAYLSFMIS